MIRFESTVRIVNFTEQLARVFHLASSWAAIAGISVVVKAVDDGSEIGASLHGFSLAANLDTESERATDLTLLHGYLARHLPPQYDVLLEPTHVHVEYDTRRKVSTIPPPGVKAAAPAPGAAGS